MGDRNTKFFYDIVKRNAARNSILAITKSDGTIVTSAADIGQEFVAYYTLLLGTEVYTLPVDSDVFEWGSKLSFEHALELCRAVTPLEVKQAIFHISDNKAPDPDEFSACFSREHGTLWMTKCARPCWTSLGVGICYDNSIMWLSLHGFFLGKKGLRQGDLMSPALFLLCMEFFSRLIKRKTSNSKFNFHPKCEKLKITHLLFANDLMLFSHIVNNELDGILARTEFTRGEMLVRYLGIPLVAQRLSVSDYSSLVDQIANCISKWTAKSISFVGRLELISSIIQGVECFWLQRFPLPAADTLWVKWVNEVYLRDTTLWDWQSKKGDSPLLRWFADIRNRFITAFGTSDTAVQCMEDWSNAKGLETSKAYEYFRLKLTIQPWKAWLGISRRMSTLPSVVKWLKKEKTGSSVQNKVRALALACTVYSL
ncbi:UNVERIFIED_CONTAM: hypothetical protein Slati_3944700 [Sesamum latifolium]|uniref:Reverse transcriptase domain-containing protein n=1 Tax=Sesamum latifolium TaxID=2727402 RepID=A0AAW2TPZ4_9LAMI